MQVFFVVFNTTLTESKLAGRRRKLAGLLKTHGIKSRTIRVDTDPATAISIIAAEARSDAVVAIDDSCSYPEGAPWFKDLTDKVEDIQEGRRPRVIYVCENHTAAGVVAAHLHPLCRQYVWRDRSGAWVSNVADAIVALEQEIQDDAEIGVTQSRTGTIDIVGRSNCFCEALTELADVVRSPCGIVTGEPGVGKMYLIRSLWQQVGQGHRMIVLPCGTFFKDYYVGSSHRKISIGREAIDQIDPYLREADEGLLVLHHVERLPTILQEELAVRLEAAAANLDNTTRLTSIDAGGLTEYDVRVIATSTYWPQVLKQTGRVIPDLIRRLSKRHVRIPTLRHRGRRDIRMLSEDILARIALRTHTAVLRLSDSATKVLGAAVWPDNISDLVRSLEHAKRRCRGKTITKKHLPKSVFESQDPNRAFTLDAIVEQAKRAAVRNALEDTGGNVAEAARQLGRDPKAMYPMMKKLGISTPRQLKN